jgi:hypothetical protein
MNEKEAMCIHPRPKATLVRLAATVVSADDVECEGEKRCEKKTTQRLHEVEGARRRQKRRLQEVEDEVELRPHRV